MTAFWIAVVVGAVVGVAYVALAVQAFLRVRRAVLAGEAVEHPVAVYDGQGDGFSIKAIAAGVASLAVIGAISLAGGFWYLPPALAIGSSIAVVAAFLVDRR